MKATGIVRRVEEYGIIGQISKNRINTRDCAVFCILIFGSFCGKIFLSIFTKREI